MTEFSQSTAISASGMQAQSQRLRFISENIANADTPGYRRKTAAFEQIVQDGRTTGRVQNGPVKLDERDLAKVFDPSHPLADTAGYFDGSNVELVVEIADAREAHRSYEANIRLFDQARKMRASLLDLLKR